MLFVAVEVIGRLGGGNDKDEARRWQPALYVHSLWEAVTGLLLAAIFMETEGGFILLRRRWWFARHARRRGLAASRSSAAEGDGSSSPEVQTALDRPRYGSAECQETLRPLTADIPCVPGDPSTMRLVLKKEDGLSQRSIFEFESKRLSVNEAIECEGKYRYCPALRSLILGSGTEDSDEDSAVSGMLSDDHGGTMQQFHVSRRTRIVKATRDEIAAFKRLTFSGLLSDLAEVVHGRVDHCEEVHQTISSHNISFADEMEHEY
jgi:hypothetical protein